MRLVFFGLSLSSSWGNGHAATYRALLRGLARRGHSLEFFERDAEWYAGNRDLPQPGFARLRVYRDWVSTRSAARAAARAADAVIVGSYFPDAVALLDDCLHDGVSPLCFYDIDTPVTLERLRAGDCPYLRADQIPGFDLYLSFTGGPSLAELESRWKARAARPLYCACDPGQYASPGQRPTPACTLSFMGTYAPDRQRKLQRLLIEPARRLPHLRFRVAGPLFPGTAAWPPNLHYTFHLPPPGHAAFYQGSLLTLNLTRQAMVEAGFSPSVRLFEAAACGCAVLSDPWPGLGEFFRPGVEILVASETAEVVRLLRALSPADLLAVGAAARERVLAHHTGDRRAAQLEALLAARRPACVP